MAATVRTSRLRQVWQAVRGQPEREVTVAPTAVVEPAAYESAPTVEIAPNDPLVAYFQSNPSVVEIDRLQLVSPALKALKAAGVKLAVPLVSQGELIGLLNLGPRLSEQEYSADDRGLLNNLATQAAPAVRVAQLVHQQQIEARERERLDQELRVARHIQQTLLPKELPSLPGWEVSAYYQPARAVGGDFYDFLPFADGKLGLVVGDVTDKGVPAALLMATTRSILRTAGQSLTSPGEVLQRVNDLLCPDIPPKMFVTCFFAILDPATGVLQYANAGHDLPYRRHAGQVSELRATGFPLGLLPGMGYEEATVTLEPGDTVLFYSDGLVEAHDPQRDMFSFPRLMRLMTELAGATALIEYLLQELHAFTGPDWEQEDDVTLVTLHHAPSLGGNTVNSSSIPSASHVPGVPEQPAGGSSWRTLVEFSVPSAEGNERLAMQKVAEAVQELRLPTAWVERLKTAVAEATMNAMEHGNQYKPDLPVLIEVLASETSLAVRVVDEGGAAEIRQPTAPDLDAKLEGLQTPRGWGLFLIRAMVDDMRVTTDGEHHIVELILNLKGDEHASQTA